MNERTAYVTDIHLDEKFPTDLGIDSRNNWITILNDISSRGIDKVIFGGDIGEVSSNHWFFESVAQFDVNVVLGNHDNYKEVQKYFTKSVDSNQSELFYTYENNYHKFIFLDSSSGEIKENQLNWLKQQLLTEKDILIFIHHPILPINAEVDKQFSLKGRDLVKTELQNIKNNISILSGHYHLDDKKILKNITQYVTPASSYQVEKIIGEIKANKDLFGYRIIELDKNKISTELVLF